MVANFQLWRGGEWRSGPQLFILQGGIYEGKEARKPVRKQEDSFSFITYFFVCLLYCCWLFAVLVFLFVSLALLLNDSLLCQRLFWTFLACACENRHGAFLLLLLGLNLNGFQKCIEARQGAAGYICVILYACMHVLSTIKVFLVVLRAELTPPPLKYIKVPFKQSLVILLESKMRRCHSLNASLSPRNRLCVFRRYTTKYSVIKSSFPPKVFRSPSLS